MMTLNEIIGFISPELSNEILDDTFQEDKPLYKAISSEVAALLRLRPIFFEQKPRRERTPAPDVATTRNRLAVPMSGDDSGRSAIRTGLLVITPAANFAPRSFWMTDYRATTPFGFTPTAIVLVAARRATSMTVTLAASWFVT